MNYEKEFALYQAVAEIDKTLAEIQSFMPSTIGEATRSISTGIDAVKKLADLAMKTQNIELQEGILELREQLLFAKEALLNAKEEISDLKEETRRLTREIEKKEEISKVKMILKRGAYYVKDSDDGPFCPRCFDVDSRQIRLSKVGPILDCPQCKNRIMPTP